MDLVHTNGKNLISEFNSYRDNFIAQYDPKMRSNPKGDQVANPGPAEEILQVLSKLDCQSVKTAADIVCNKLPGVMDSEVNSFNQGITQSAAQIPSTDPYVLAAAEAAMGEHAEKERQILQRLFSSQLELFNELIEHRLRQASPDIQNALGRSRSQLTNGSNIEFKMQQPSSTVLPDLRMSHEQMMHYCQQEECQPGMAKGGPRSSIYQKDKNLSNLHDSSDDGEDHSVCRHGSSMIPSELRKYNDFKAPNAGCPHGARRHYAKSMCMNCYHRSGRTKKAWACPHSNKLHYSKGLCQNCYLANYYRERKAKNLKNKREKQLLAEQASEKLDNEAVAQNKQKIDANITVTTKSQRYESEEFSHSKDVPIEHPAAPEGHL